MICNFVIDEEYVVPCVVNYMPDKSRIQIQARGVHYSAWFSGC
jgi:hypothetical protein